MTLNQAIKSNLRIEPGRKVTTRGGWWRHDSVLLDGHEIGRVRTRRLRGHTEIITATEVDCIQGYDIDWLLQQGRGLYGVNTAAKRGL